MIIAVDFDNTIARTTFPEIHGEIAGAIAALWLWFRVKGASC